MKLNSFQYKVGEHITCNKINAILKNEETKQGISFITPFEDFDFSQEPTESFNELLKHCKYPEKKKLLSNAVLRILPKAKYSDVVTGDFGLNLPFYCHFTSRIMRYADLTVHRSLAFALKWEMDDLDFMEDHKAICQINNFWLFCSI